jgi:hypothetical protein
MYITRIARILDANGNYFLADKLDKYAQQGVMNLDKIIPNAEQSILNWIKGYMKDGDLPNADPQYRGQYYFDELPIPNWLSPYVKNIVWNTKQFGAAYYDPSNKTLGLPKSVGKNNINQIFIAILHELRHSVDPRFSNKKYMSNDFKKYYNPWLIKELLNFDFDGNPQSYEEFLSDRLKEYLRENYKNINENEINPSELEKIKSNINKSYTKEDYDKAVFALKNNIDLHSSMPIEHSSKLGDLKFLLNKNNLDAIKAKYFKDLSNQEWQNYLSKSLLNINSKEFEYISSLLSENNGYEFSKTVKNANNAKWFDQYKKLVSNSILAYSDENNRQSFFIKAAKLESLVAKNPRAWNKFINSNIATRILSSKVSILFKNLGANSKALSESLKSLNLNSPYWALIEPVLEFALYQFGLLLENPSGYSLETPEQKMIRDLNARINEILADNKIQDKRGYFIKNYGSYLKTLGTMERNELLGKFPAMGFNNFMNIGRNIGQK